jgi:hypothetical protein
VTQQPIVPRCARIFDRVAAAASAFLLLVTTLCYAFLWDAVAPLTLLPQWLWTIVGLSTAYLSRRAWPHPWLSWTLIGLWLVTTLAFSDNLRSLARGSIRQEPTLANLRVITLNCAGNSNALADVVQRKPNLVLLQEIPSREAIAQFAHDCFGDQGTFIAGWDCAIVAPAPIQQLDNHNPPQHIRGVVHFDGVGPVEVTSLRLVPPEARLDLWNPDAWKACTDNRRLRRAQLAEALRPHKDSVLPQIVGGDFNAPVSDNIYRRLRGFRDAHRDAGRGWGNTAIAQFPIARPDQIRSQGFKATACRARTTPHSDHRMVVADLVVDASPGRAIDK